VDFLFHAGTSSGFGRRLVASALARGDRVIATARSLEKLQDLIASCDRKSRDNLRVLQLDVTEGEAALKIKADQVAAIWGQIDVLVNNAGIGFPSLLEEGGCVVLHWAVSLTRTPTYYQLCPSAKAI